MDIDNQTTYQAMAIPGWSPTGVWQNTLVVKAGFTFDSSGAVLTMPESDSIILVDEFHGDPNNSSLLAASEISPIKFSLDLLVSGAVDVPDGACEHGFALSISNGSHTVWEKSAILLGPREWKKTLLGSTPSKPTPIVNRELRWEHAFGGAVPDTKNESLWHRFDRNPSGIGWVKNPWHRADALPNIEQYPLLSRPHQRPSPVGFGPVAITWSPRWAAFQTLDSERALQGDNPYPNTPSHHLFQCAPEDQQLPFSYLNQHELTLTGVYQESPKLTIPLNQPPLVIAVRSTNKPDQSLAIQWDTLLLDISRKTLHWIGRVGIASDPNLVETRQYSLTLPTNITTTQGKLC